MREIRIHISQQNYDVLKKEADNLGITVRQLIHSRALGSDMQLVKVKLLCNEIAQCRGLLNRIVQRETNREEGLYEDDIIRLEEMMSRVERITAVYVRAALKEAKRDG